MKRKPPEETTREYKARVAHGQASYKLQLAQASVDAALSVLFQRLKTREDAVVRHRTTSVTLAKIRGES